MTRSLNLYKIKASKTFSKDFRKNLDYLKDKLKDKTIGKTTVIYDGESIPPLTLNVRDV